MVPILGQTSRANRPLYASRKTMAIPVAGKPRWMAGSGGRKSVKLSREPYYTLCWIPRGVGCIWARRPGFVGATSESRPLLVGERVIHVAEEDNRVVVYHHHASIMRRGADLKEVRRHLRNCSTHPYAANALI